MGNKKTQLFWSIWNLVESFLLASAGILTILFRDNARLLSVIGYVIGAFVILDGTLRIMLYFTGFKQSEESEVLVGGFEASLGVVICLQHSNFISILIQFLYSLLIIIGALVLAMAIVRIIKHKSTLFMPILTIILGSLFCGLGVSILIIYEFTSDESQLLIMFLIGSILLLAGGAQFVITLIQTIKSSKSKKEVIITSELNNQYGNEANSKNMVENENSSIEVITADK